MKVVTVKSNPEASELAKELSGINKSLSDISRNLEEVVRINRLTSMWQTVIAAVMFIAVIVAFILLANAGYFEKEVVGEPQDIWSAAEDSFDTSADIMQEVVQNVTESTVKEQVSSDKAIEVNKYIAELNSDLYGREYLYRRNSDGAGNAVTGLSYSDVGLKRPYGRVWFAPTGSRVYLNGDLILPELCGVTYLDYSRFVVADMYTLTGSDLCEDDIVTIDVGGDFGELMARVKLGTANYLRINVERNINPELFKELRNGVKEALYCERLAVDEIELVAGDAFYAVYWTFDGGARRQYEGIFIKEDGVWVIAGEHKLLSSNTMDTEVCRVHIQQGVEVYVEGEKQAPVDAADYYGELRNVYLIEVGRYVEVDYGAFGIRSFDTWRSHPQGNGAHGADEVGLREPLRTRLLNILLNITKYNGAGTLRLLGMDSFYAVCSAEDTDDVDAYVELTVKHTGSGWEIANEEHSSYR